MCISLFLCLYLLCLLHILFFHAFWFQDEPPKSSTVVASGEAKGSARAAEVAVPSADDIKALLLQRKKEVKFWAYRYERGNLIHGTPNFTCAFYLFLDAAAAVCE